MPNIKDAVKSILPEGLRMGQLVVRRARAWEQAGVIFVHVPKNGGTSINTALYGRFMGHYRVRDIERFRHNLLRVLPSLAVTRNPWARAYSAWGFARRGAEMKDGAQIRYPDRYQQSAFVSFERFVLEWLPSRNLAREDYVFRPQTHFLLNRRGQIGVGHLGRIEEPQSYLPWLEETLGCSVEIGYLNRTVDPTHYREAYTPEMRNTVADCYAEDLKWLYYDF